MQDVYKRQVAAERRRLGKGSGVAAPAGYRDDPSRPVRVATKFVNIAKRYYASMGRDIDIIKLNGSIELAPILGLSDVIVDIVETGTTLRENGLQVVTEFMPCLLYTSQVRQFVQHLVIRHLYRLFFFFRCGLF